MRKEKKVIALLRDLAAVLADECARSPAFAAKLESLVSGLAEGKPHAEKRGGVRPTGPVPDIHAELESRGETNFRLWLRDQPLPVLRAVIRAQDLDSTRRTSKWKEAEKLADFITDSLRARLSRGSAFIRAKD